MENVLLFVSDHIWAIGIALAVCAAAVAYYVRLKRKKKAESGFIYPLW